MRLGELLREVPRAELGIREAIADPNEIVVGLPVPDGWEEWLEAMYPRHISAGFAPHHAELYRHLWDLELEDEPEPFVAIWARGGAKSSTAELLTAGLGLRGRRRYAWYVRETQDRADDSIRNIAALLEASSVELHYPAHAERMLSKYGHSRGWTAQRLRTRGGFTIDAIGLDTAARGLKVEDQRPDLIILDDLDAKHDTPLKTTKKLTTLLNSVIPAGTSRTAIVGVQNLIIPDGIFSRLVTGKADYLATAKVSGPIPALEGMRTEIEELEDGRRKAVIVEGVPTWAGQSIEACQKLMDRIGLRAFKQESQHEVFEREGALWKLEDIRYNTSPPDFTRVVVGVDPSGGGDAIGIIVAALGTDGRGYVLTDSSRPGSVGPLKWGRAVVDVYDLLGGDRIVAEKNYGGDMVASTIQVAAGDRRLPVRMVSASRGKAIRAEPVAALYQAGLVDHVGPMPELEGELVTWAPGDPESPNRLDALVWALSELFLKKKRRVEGFIPGASSA